MLGPSLKMSSMSRRCVTADTLDRRDRAVGDGVERRVVDELDRAAALQRDQPLALELREDAADGLEGEAEIVADIGADHRQYDRARCPPGALGTARQGDEERG